MTGICKNCQYAVTIYSRGLCTSCHEAWIDGKIEVPGVSFECPCGCAS